MWLRVLLREYRTVNFMVGTSGKLLSMEDKFHIKMAGRPTSAFDSSLSA